MKIGFHRHSNVHIPALPSIGERCYMSNVHRSCGFNAEEGLTIPRSVPIRATSGRFIDEEGTARSLSTERFSIPPSLPQLIVPKVARLISHTRILTAKSRRYRGSRLTACITIPSPPFPPLAPCPISWHQPSGRFRERVALGKMLPPAITGNVLPLLVG